MTNWIVENWFIIVALATGIGGLGCAIYKFAGLPTKEQVAKIKQWLLLAVTTAEKELGGGTGQLKLRYVYDMFVEKYPVAAKIVTFEVFSAWVDEALEGMKEMLETNEAARSFISNGGHVQKYRGGK